VRTGYHHTSAEYACAFIVVDENRDNRFNFLRPPCYCPRSLFLPACC
jgi:hypothetical protein